jgi:alpha-tubulin suppressor-like RCC1 family protein
VPSAEQPLPEADAANEVEPPASDAAIDEHDAGTDEAEAMTDCVGLDCPCPSGLQASLEGCVDVDECATDNGGCGSAECVNEHGGPPSCRCPDGLVDVHGDQSLCLGTLAVSVGEHHVCAISQANNAYCWGEGRYGQLGDGARTKRLKPTLLAPASGWTAIAAGGYLSCGIREGGMYCWSSSPTMLGQVQGTQSTDRPMRVGSDAGWTEVAAADMGACGIRSGELYCWGQDVISVKSTDGGLAILPTIYEPKRVGYAVHGSWSKLTAGQHHYCALRGTTPLCFGAGYSPNVLGEGAVVNTDFIAAGDDGQWDVLAAGANKICAIDDGELYCWGQGALGNGVYETLRRPTRVGSDNDWTAVAAGLVSCGIRSGEMYCWGHELDTGRDDGVRERVLVPTRVGDASDWTAVYTRRETMYGLQGKALYCWGSDADAQLGRGTDRGVPIPTRVDDADDYTLVAAGSQSCGARPDGLYCWGARYVGIGADGVAPEFAYDEEPQRFDSSSSWLGVDQGSRSACGIRGGSLYCWGYSRPQKSIEITEISSSDTWQVIAKGEDHACGVARGRLHCWGTNETDISQLGDPSLPMTVAAPQAIGTSTNWTALSAGPRHTCGISSGGLYCWGAPWIGYSLGTGMSRNPVPTRVGTESDWTAISSSSSHSCGLRGNALYCWGGNYAGALGTGDTMDRSTPMFVSSGWSAVSAGSGHTCGIRSGAMYCWGNNESGQLGDDRAADRASTPVRIGTEVDWSAVSAKGGTTCALRRGAIYCWGNNSYGQAAAPLPFSDAPVLVVLSL